MFNSNKNNQSSPASADDKATADKNTTEGKPSSASASGEEQKNKDTKAKPRKKNLVRVKFDRSYTPYLKGEIAGLKPKLAEQLIKDKICFKV